MTYTASSITATLKPAGLEKCKGLITAAFTKDRPTRAGKMIRATRNGPLSWRNI